MERLLLHSQQQHNIQQLFPPSSQRIAHGMLPPGSQRRRRPRHLLVKQPQWQVAQLPLAQLHQHATIPPLIPAVNTETEA